MPESSELKAETEPFAGGPVTPARLGGVVGIADVAAFSVIGLLLFGDVVAGALAGLFVGAGSFLFLPVLLTAEAGDGMADMVPDTGGHALRSFHRVAAGFGLTAGGIALVAWQLDEGGLGLGVGVALLVTGIVYVPLAFVLPNAEL